MGTRISGLSGSGIDVDAAVQQIMKAARSKYDKLGQQETLLEWKKTEYNNVYNSIDEFNKTVVNSSLDSYLAPKSVTSSNESVATISANADAGNVNHSITVLQLADGARNTSSATITAAGNKKDTLKNQFGLASDSKFTISITNNGQAAKIEVDPTKSITELAASINNAGINVRASYDANYDRFFLYTTDTGTKSSLDFTGSSTAGLNFLQNNLKLSTTTANGKNSIFSLDGIGSNSLADTNNLQNASNNFTISGVTYKLKSTSTTPVNVAISADNDKTIANVKSFIDTYNTFLKKINAEKDETKYKDYLPLTDDQKSEMKDNDISLWEKKAKSGLLHNDSIMQSLSNSLRSAFSTPVAGLTGKYRSAEDIGIQTGKDWTEGGKLYVDEEKLSNALKEDPEAVRKILGAQGDTNGTQGCVQRLKTCLKKASDDIVVQAGKTANIKGDTTSVIAKQATTYAKKMVEMNKVLKAREDRYYKQYDAMEQAYSKLNQQSSWLTSQLK